MARYSDGHGYCFTFGCEYYEPGEGEDTTDLPPPSDRKMFSLLPIGEVKALPLRRISQETAAKWGYSVSKMGDKVVQLANYRDEKGRVYKQKVRTADKKFSSLGDTKDLRFYGQNIWRDGGKMIVVTEGELDALSVSQAQGNKWPVVSLPNGAQSARKAVKANIEYLDKFDTVVLMFDMDDAGHEAAEEVAPLLRPGRVKIAKLPLKDANEMLQAHRESEIIDAVWGAKPFRPDGIISINDLKEKALEEPEWGLPWFMPTLTDLTYGRRYAEIYALGAGTGTGKTDWFTQQLAFDVTELGLKVGGIILEQPVGETAKRLAGKVAGRLFHIPDGEWTREELSDALDLLDDKVFLYDHFGETDWGVIKARIRYMAVALDIRVIYIDHLTAMADPTNERSSLEQIMKEMAGLAHELNLIIHFISHLSTPEGKSHEEGGRVSTRHFKGARAISFWCNFMFGLERNQQADDKEERLRTTFRVLKDRNTGQATGETFFIRYDFTTGLLNEAPPELEDADDFDRARLPTSEDF